MSQMQERWRFDGKDWADTRALKKRPAISKAESGALTRDYKTIMARINRAGWVALRTLSAQRDMPLEEMIIDALNNHLRANGKPPVIEKRKRPDAVPAPSDKQGA